ncbi:BatA domain-containing protein [Verrucomicrobium spinosum]|uniref:BatA domain-containing protein n=1 Tax=Verrucomicrobium spinosum TaxID=2736 RepID=UPI00094670A6|nr:BatA domain-containing protein [Verrucomicrobium spinosum]
MSLLNTGFLWALAALAVPLWVHLRRRMQYRQLPVGSLRFLNEVLQERRRRSRFEEIPLLLLRLLCVILLAVVFCRPFFSSSVKAVADPAETVILLDASGSVTGAMKTAGMDFFQRAAADVAEGGKLTLAQFSDEVAVISDAGEWTPRAGAPTDLTRAMNWPWTGLVLATAERVSLGKWCSSRIWRRETCRPVLRESGLQECRWKCTPCGRLRCRTPPCVRSPCSRLT